MFGPQTQTEANLSCVDALHTRNPANKFIIDILDKFTTLAKGFDDDDLAAFANHCKVVQS